MTTRRTSTSWRPGQSGNPAGRRRGSGKVAALRASIEADVPAILEALTAQALAGDPQAARLLLERTVPPLRPEERGVVVNVRADAPLADQARSILAAAAGGEIAPGQAATLLTSVAHLARAIATDELVRRVEALEERARDHKS
jgi:hypothetical protein